MKKNYWKTQFHLSEPIHHFNISTVMFELEENTLHL